MEKYYFHFVCGGFLFLRASYIVCGGVPVELASSFIFLLFNFASRYLSFCLGYFLLPPLSLVLSGIFVEEGDSGFPFGGDFPSTTLSTIMKVELLVDHRIHINKYII